MPTHLSRPHAALTVLALLVLAGCAHTPAPASTSTARTNTPSATAAAATPTGGRTAPHVTSTPPPAATAPTTSARPTSPTRTTASPTKRPHGRHTTAAVPERGGYSTSTNPDGTTTRWNPCQPITYRINTVSAPSGAVPDIKAALTRVSAATGLRFTYTGTTTTVPTSTTLTGPGTPDLIFAWATPGSTDLLDNRTESARGGWQSQPNLDPATGLISWRITRGYVLLDTTDAHTWKAGFGTGRRRGTLLLHEIGHAIGLNHTTSPGQIMNPQITTTSTSTWGPGDRRGLTAVGATHGCLP